MSIYYILEMISTQCLSITSLYLSININSISSLHLLYLRDEVNSMSLLHHYISQSMSTQCLYYITQLISTQYLHYIYYILEMKLTQCLYYILIQFNVSITLLRKRHYVSSLSSSLSSQYQSSIEDVEIQYTMINILSLT